MEVKINPLCSDDLDRVTQIHLAAFPARALSSLGSEAVQRYYHWLLTGPHQATNLGAWQNEVLAGYCFGGKFNGALSGYLRKNRRYLTWRIMTHPWLIFNALVRERITLATGLLKVKRSKQATKTIPQKSFGILAIAVDPTLQRSGVGRILMKASEDEAQKQGYSQMGLSVDRSNQQATNFYLGIGWKKVVSESGEWNGRMVKAV